MNIGLCKYKHILGIPNKGLHKNYFGFATFDILATIFVAFVIKYIFIFINPDYSYNYLYILFILFIIGIICHRVFCVRTKVDRLLFT